MRVVLLATFCCVLCALSPRLAVAQSLPAAVDDNWLRQRERDALLRHEQESRPEVRLQPATPAVAMRLPAVEVPCFRIDHVRIDGEAAASLAWLASAADHSSDGERDTARGRCLGTDGVHIVQQRVQQALLQRGYVTTRVLATPQDLSAGTLTLTVLPGRVRTIRFADGTPARAHMGNAMTQQAGELLDLRALEQSLENFKRVPSVDADFEIRPSTHPDARPGDSDIVVRWSQARPVRINLSLDDAGVRSTGRLQSVFTLAVDHGLALNDLFYISFGGTVGDRAPGTHDNQSQTIYYAQPWRNWLLSFTHSDWRYRQSVDSGQVINLYRGSSRNSELAVSRLLYRDALRTMTGSLRLWWRDSDNHINDAELEQQRRHTAGWEFLLSHRERVGDGTLDASLVYRRGTGAFGATAAPEQAHGGGSARMRIVRADARLSWPFSVASHSWRYSVGARAQWNGTPLSPPDRFAIGNRYTVRGFDGESLLIGDRGWLIRQEIGRFVGVLQSELYAGIDTGRVGGPSSARLLGHQLSGAVLGLRGSVDGIAWDAFIGRPLSRPEGFLSAATTGGFYLSASF